MNKKVSFSKNNDLQSPSLSEEVWIRAVSEAINELQEWQNKYNGAELMNNSHKPNHAYITNEFKSPYYLLEICYFYLIHSNNNKRSHGK